MSHDREFSSIDRSAERGAIVHGGFGVSRELDRWFVTEVLCHEAALTRYLRRAWRRQAEISDLRQEIYIRVYESAAAALPAVPRAFLFTTARNLIFDRLRHERIVSIDYTQDFDFLHVLADEVSPERRLSARQELTRLAAALDELSDATRAVIWLRRVEGLSQKETAGRLRMPEGTVESHLCRGMRALMLTVFGGPTGKSQEAARGSDHETEHG